MIEELARDVLALLDLYQRYVKSSAHGSEEGMMDRTRFQVAAGKMRHVCEGIVRPVKGDLFPGGDHADRDVG